MNTDNWEPATLVVYLEVFSGIRLDHHSFLGLNIHKEVLLKERLTYAKLWNTVCHFRRKIKQIITVLRYDFRVGSCFGTQRKFKSPGGNVLGAIRDVYTYLMVYKILMQAEILHFYLLITSTILQEHITFWKG